MNSIGAFIHVTVDGFFAGPNGEIDWFKSIRKDDEFEKRNHQQAQSKSTLLMGRTTYQMMKSYWPTPDAQKNDPGMARVMIESPKVVFSKTMEKVEDAPNWKNVTVVRDIDRDAILALKEKTPLTILGSGTIVQQLSNLGLVDEYQIIVVPIVLGAGKLLFKDVRTMDLALRESKSFKNGIVVNTYARGG